MVTCSPEEFDALERSPADKQLIDLFHGGLRVVGALVEGSGCRIIRVEIFAEAAVVQPCAEAGGASTLQYAAPARGD